MIQYGLISETDAVVLEKTIDLVCSGFPNKILNYCEIGLYNGRTTNGVFEYMKLKQRHCRATGIDNFKDKEELRFIPQNTTVIRGNSNEVYNQIEDNSQHLIFVDGCHCFAHVISDFFCYAPKVKVGGYLAFHDTGKHIKPLKDFQHGDEKNPDAYISVRKALNKIGLCMDSFPLEDNFVVDKWYDEWELIFDEADETNEAGGIAVFKKLY